MRRAVHIAFAALLSIAISMVGVGAYPLAWAGEVSCCCGEHSAENACGCPSCPSADVGGDEEANEDRLLSCSGTSLMVTNAMVKIVPATGVARMYRPALRRRVPSFTKQAVPASIAAKPDVPDS